MCRTTSSLPGDGHRYSTEVMPDLNPYAPPQSRFANGAVLAKKYRADYSRLPLVEFRRVSGAGLRSIPFWLAMKSNILKFDQQVFDAPRPLLSDLCSFEQTPEDLQDSLLRFRSDASDLGFMGDFYSVKRSEGLVVLGCAMRMIHQSGDSFLTTIYSRTGDLRTQVTQITSRFGTSDRFATFTTSNDVQRFDLPSNSRAVYRLHATLPEMLDVHHRHLTQEPFPPTKISDVSDVALVVDSLVTQFYDRMVSMGVFLAIDDDGG